MGPWGHMGYGAPLGPYGALGPPGPLWAQAPGCRDERSFQLRKHDVTNERAIPELREVHRNHVIDSHVLQPVSLRRMLRDERLCGDLHRRAAADSTGQQRTATDSIGQQSSP